MTSDSFRPEPSSQSFHSRPVRLGRYHLLKRIGVGGMAEIWVAKVASLSGVEKVCVVKRILPHLSDSPEFVRMFLDEARIAATLNHPNLVQMYDVEEIDHVPLISMEYLHGEDLRTVKKELKSHKKRMPLEHAITIGIGIAAGLHYAHEQVGFDGSALNIVHRDISPHNVFVTYDGGVKILDFGIAKASNRSNETRDGALKGKIPYMSPEQCRSEKLDRRTDIYSTGIILYEITTGNRIFRRGATEFEIMRSIVEDPVTPPTKTTIDYPEALERIVLKCLAKKRAERYASARELQIDLDTFAREHRLQASNLALSSFMSDLFGQRAEAWREALAEGGDILSQLVDRGPPSELPSGDWMGDEGGEPPPQQGRAEDALFSTQRSAPVSSRGVAPLALADTEPSVASSLGEPRLLTVTKRKMGSLLVVSLSGRMTEAFQGQALAREVSGRVLFDLAGVERVTSFGVREWLQMLNEALSRVSELYIARCSEPIVNQVSMIRRFVGDGRIVSFYGPYRCEACGAPFHRLFDCELDAQVIRSAEPPPATCTRCGETGSFDDDAESYFAFATTFAGVAVPPDVRAMLEELAKADAGGGPGDAIEKIVDDRSTRVRVGCKIDGTVRWKRVLDGIEGDLVLDLTNTTGVAPEGARGLELALRGLGGEVKEIRIEGCPWPLVEHLAAAKPPLRVTIVSALVEARCEACNAMRSTLLDLKEGVAAALEGRDPYVPCKRCNAPLSFAPLRPLLRRLGGVNDEPPRPAAPSAPGPVAVAPGPVAVAPGPVAVAPEPARPARGSRARTPAVLVAVLAAGVALGLGLAYRRAEGPAPAVSGGPALPVAPRGETPVVVSGAPALPAWTATPFSLEGDRIFVVGRGTAQTRETALAAARNDAITEITARVLDALAGSPIYDLVRSGGVKERRAETTEAEVTRYLQQVGAFATPERNEARFQELDGSVAAIARYRLRKEDFEAAVQAYRRTASLGGLSAAPVFPQLERKSRTKGDVVVVAVEDKGPAAAAGIRVGDVVLSVNGRSVSGLDAFESAAQKPTESGLIELSIEAGGVRRAVKLPRGDSR